MKFWRKIKNFFSVVPGQPYVSSTCMKRIKYLTDILYVLPRVYEKSEYYETFSLRKATGQISYFFNRSDNINGEISDRIGAR